MKKILIVIMILLLVAGPADADYLKQYYDDENTDSQRQMRNATGYYNYYSQSIIAASTYDLTKVAFNVSKYAGHPGEFYCYIYGATGTSGTNAYPNATCLATSGALTTAVTSTPQLVNFSFSPAYTVKKGTAYTILVHTTQQTSYNAYVGADSSSPTDPGNYAAHIGGQPWTTWHPSTTRDLIYYIYSTTPPPPAPNITGYGPTGLVWADVESSKTFNVTTDQPTKCYWYADGILKETNSTEETTHTYTNTSLKNGNRNVTAVTNNSNGTDQQTWLFEVGLVTFEILKDQPTVKTKIAEWELIYKGSRVATAGVRQTYTFGGWDYALRFANGTEISSQTAPANNSSLWWDTTALPTGKYYITAGVQPGSGSESFVNPTFIAAGGAGILFIAAGGRKVVSSWRNRRRKRRN